MRLAVKRVRAGAQLPRYATEGAAGMDLHACVDHPFPMPPGEVTLVPTGVAVAIPPGYVGLIRDRSSLAAAGVHTVAGVIDSDYRGEIVVAVHNTRDTERLIQPGDRIAQMLILPCPPVEIEEALELPHSARGAGSFGSTGR